MSESNVPLQLGLKHLLVVTVLFAAYFAVMRSIEATVANTLLGALFLATRFPCVAFARRLSLSVPLMILGLVIPAAMIFDSIAHQWNAPHSRWSTGDWIVFPIYYSIFPVAVFLFDVSTAEIRTRRQNWLRFVIEVLVVLPVWISIVVYCGFHSISI